MTSKKRVQGVYNTCRKPNIIGTAYNPLMCSTIMMSRPSFTNFTGGVEKCVCVGGEDLSMCISIRHTTPVVLDYLRSNLVHSQALI